MQIPYGYCQCGCGMKTDFYKDTNKQRGTIRGLPAKFIRNHHTRGRLNPKWKGGITTNDGYIHLKNNTNKRSDSHGYTLEHILVVEEAIGKSLPFKAVIHHFNGNIKDNSKGNLVVCQSQEYHMLLHMRTRAFLDCGHADWLKCKICHNYDRPQNLYIGTKTGNQFHRYCHAQYERNRRHKNDIFARAAERA